MYIYGLIGSMIINSVLLLSYIQNGHFYFNSAIKKNWHEKWRIFNIKIAILFREPLFSIDQQLLKIWKPFTAANSS